MLILSSLLGIVIGDVAWLQALQLLGARRVIMVDSLKPFLASILGYLILGEDMSVMGSVGMFVTIVGVVVVSLEGVHDSDSNSNEKKNRPNEDKLGDGKAFLSADSESKSDVQLSPMHVPGGEDGGGDPENAKQSIDSVNRGSNNNSTDNTSNPGAETLRRGYLFALFNVIFDAYGAVLTKQYGIIFSISEINLIRFGFAAISVGTLAGCFKLRSLCLRGSSPALNVRFAPISEKIVINNSSDVDLDDSVTAHEVVDHSVMNSYGEPLLSEDNNSSLMWYEFPYMPQMDWVKIAVGVLFVTYTCPSLFNFALFNLKLGLCLTITSLGPIFSIPLVYLMKNEKTSMRATAGSVLSFVGVAMLCLTEREEEQ